MLWCVFQILWEWKPHLWIPTVSHCLGQGLGGNGHLHLKPGGISSMQICLSGEFHCTFLQVKTINFRMMTWDIFFFLYLSDLGRGNQGMGLNSPSFRVEKEIPRFAINVLYNFREVSNLFASALDEWKRDVVIYLALRLLWRWSCYRYQEVYCQ